MISPLRSFCKNSTTRATMGGCRSCNVSVDVVERGILRGVSEQHQFKIKSKCAILIQRSIWLDSFVSYSNPLWSSPGMAKPTAPTGAWARLLDESAAEFLVCYSHRDDAKLGDIVKSWPSFLPRSKSAELSLPIGSLSLRCANTRRSTAA